jgi:hypothetical protein
MGMNDKLQGKIVFLPLNEVRDFQPEQNNVLPDSYQPLKGGIISKHDDNGTYKVIFDVSGTEDYWDGYVKGFFYNDGKFRGNFHYVSYANEEKEVLNGDYIATKDGYEIRGTAYQSDSDSYGFYIELGKRVFETQIISPKKGQQIKAKTVKIISRSSSVVQQEIRKKADTLKKVLNNDLLLAITKKAETRKNSKDRKGYDLYSHIVRMHPSPQSVDHLILAICIAYSWMPTMLDIYVGDKKEFRKLLQAVKRIGEIKTHEQFEKQSPVIESALMKLTVSINNSVVGTSKVLHIFYPANWPIIDRNVLKGWNHVFKKYYSNYPVLKLPTTMPTDSKRQVSLYMKYWKLLSFLKINTRSKSIRNVENPFYWIGMK